ncbi:MAG: hypothetical protein ABIH49_00565 [archaeon]
MGDTDLGDFSEGLKSIRYFISLQVWTDRNESRINDVVLADSDRNAIQQSLFYVNDLASRGYLNLATRVLYQLRRPNGEVFYADINACPRSLDSISGGGG